VSESRAAIWRFYAYRISVSNGFWLPVSVAYLEQVRGFGLDGVGLVMGAFSIAMVAAEIPTGYVGDRLGRRRSLLLGNVVLAVFMAGYTVVESVPAYLALYVFWAFGWAFRSGTADAWLYELLDAADEPGEFTRIRGRATTVQMTFEAVTAVLAGVLVVYGWALPFLANAAVALLGIPVLLTAPDPRSDRAGSAADDEVAGEPFTLGKAVQALRLQVRRPSVRWLVLYATLFSVVYQLSYTFEQPAMTAVGVPTTALGVVYAVFKIGTAAGGSVAGWVSDRLGIRGVFAAMIPVWGIAYLGAAFVPVLVVPALITNRSVMAVVTPVRNQYLNDRLDDVGRATVLSGVSMVMMTAGGVAKLLGGYAAGALGTARFLGLSGAVLAALAGLLWVTVSPVRSENDGMEGPTSAGGAPAAE